MKTETASETFLKTAMDNPPLYIWQDYFCDPVLSALWRAEQDTAGSSEKENCLRLALPGLLSFAREKALTPKPVTEYILRALLEADNVYTRALQDRRSHTSGPLSDAAAHDVQFLWQNLLLVDWNAAFASIGLEGLDRSDSPSSAAHSRACLPAYSASLEEILSIADSKDLQKSLEAHVRRFGGGHYAAYRAYSWKDAALVGLETPDLVSFDDLLEIDYQRETLIRNTEDFLAGRPANNVLLCGSMGSGKTSCIKAMMRTFEDQDLRLVAVQRRELQRLDELLACLRGLAPRFIVFLDDLSFEEDDGAYSQLKTALDGDLSLPPENVLFYATSNRRNIMRETWNDRAGEEVHAADTHAEKQSLAERFGIKLFFGRYGQAEYFSMIAHGLEQRGLAFDENARAAAIEWERNYHARSGRSAANFIKHYIAKTGDRP